MKSKTEDLDERLDDLIAKPKGYEWTPADYQTIWEAYERADQETKDEFMAMLRGKIGVAASVSVPQ
jgi:hypothetical protein